MNYQIEQYRVLYEKTYREALKANYDGNFALAEKRFLESAAYLRKLASMDPANRSVFLDRASKMDLIAQSLSKKRPAPVAETAAAKTDGGSYAESGQSEVSPADDMSSFYTFFSAKDLKDGFESVIGLDEAKAAITEYVINPIKYPDAYNYSFMSNKCILLEGPPGTGKTTFAKAVAKEIEQPFALVNVASLVNCYVGETGKIIDRVFESLRKYVDENKCGITVFFDEFDEIAKSRSGDDKASQTAVPALLRNLDGIKENKGFLVIANTNCVDLLDAGILSRFRRKIFIPLPDESMRRHFFEMKLKQLEPEYYGQLDLQKLAEVSDGMSGRAITQVCDDFLHHVGGIKAGIRTSSNLNDDMIAIIAKH